MRQPPMIQLRGLGHLVEGCRVVGDPTRCRKWRSHSSSAVHVFQTVDLINLQFFLSLNGCEQCERVILMLNAALRSRIVVS